MKLSNTTLQKLPDGIARPSYDRSALTAGIVHIGLGNFHRAHMGVYLDRLHAGHCPQKRQQLLGKRPGVPERDARAAARERLDRLGGGLGQVAGELGAAERVRPPLHRRKEGLAEAGQGVTEGRDDPHPRHHHRSHRQ